MLTPVFTKLLPSARKSSPRTILIISSHAIARAFLVEGYEISELVPLHTDKTDYEYTDKEGFSYVSTSVNSGIGTITGFREKNKMHYDNVFAHFMVEEIGKIDREYHAEQIVLYVPKRLKEPLTELFPKAYEERLHIKTGNHIRIAFPRLFTLLEEGLYPPDKK